MITEEVYEFMRGYTVRANRWVSKDEAFNKRLIKAHEQLEKPTVSKQKIIEYSKEFLDLYGLKNIHAITVDPTDFLNSKTYKSAYLNLKEKYKLNNVKHLVWMKFTTDDHLGVIAASDDINFNLDNTSGKIISALGKKWCTKEVIIIPLPNIGDSQRADIEIGIGNYLIRKYNVPVLDYYSHRY